MSAEAIAMSPEQIVAEAATTCGRVFTRLGFCARHADKSSWPVRFDGLYVTSDNQLGILSVDVQNLPMGTRVADLEDAKTLYELEAALHKPISVARKLGQRRGLFYGIQLTPPLAPAHVKLPEKVTLDLAQRPTGGLQIPLGVSAHGPLWLPLHTAGHTSGHILVGGATRMGKTRWLYALLYALLIEGQGNRETGKQGNESDSSLSPRLPVAVSPLPFQLAIVDPKAVDMLKFRRLPQVAAYADDAEQAHEVTEWLSGELSRRQQLFAQHNATNLAQYNQHATEPLALVIAIVDEFADIAITQGLNSSFYRELMRLVAKGAAFGIVLVMATQNPKAEVVNTLIRDNCSVRLAFRCESPYQSKAIIGRVGADELPAVRGRMVARVYDEYHTLQGYWVDDAEIERAIQAWTPTKPPPLLSELHTKLIAYSLEQLDGAFVIDRLAQAFMGQIARDKLLILAQEWQAKGWLSPYKRGGPAKPRQVTPLLLTLYHEQLKETTR
jgi:hypothetical protein